MLYNFLYCLDVVKLKSFSKEGEHRITGNKMLVAELRWHNWEIINNWHRYQKIRPLLDEMGLKSTDRVISLPDPSFCTSLWHLRLNGWSNFMNYNKTEDINRLIDKGAKYLIIGNSEYLKEDFLQPFLKNKLIEYNDLHVFKLN
jgi:hypothetical protein